MAEEVDVRGLPCPQPVINTKKALQELEEGQITVLVDSVESRDNVQRFAQSQGCQVDVRERDGVFYLDIVKRHPASIKGERSSDVILIGSDQLGTGDGGLGEKLMESFLNTLWHAEPKPAKFIFVNSGVKLTIEGSAVLETLQMLEDEGVEVLSCGACPEHYRLKEKSRVGLVTNMYDVVDSLLSASKVITL